MPRVIMYVPYTNPQLSYRKQASSFVDAFLKSSQFQVRVLKFIPRKDKFRLVAATNILFQIALTLPSEKFVDYFHDGLEEDSGVNSVERVHLRLCLRIENLLFGINRCQPESS